MKKELLQQFIENKLSSYKIAEITKKSPTTVRYWIRKHKLSITKVKSDVKLCPCCKLLLSRTDFYTRRKSSGTSVYCKSCTSTQTLLRQRRTKELVVAYMGGKCKNCGYNKCLGALQVHHLDPTTKSKDFYNFKLRTFNEEFKAELDNCVLLCANCHLELHTLYC